MLSVSLGLILLLSFLMYSWSCDVIDHRKVIGTVVSREDYLVPKAGGVFDAEEYDAHPDRYRSTFAEKVSLIHHS